MKKVVMMIVVMFLVGCQSIGVEAFQPGEFIAVSQSRLAEQGFEPMVNPVLVPRGRTLMVPGFVGSNALFLQNDFDWTQGDAIQLRIGEVEIDFPYNCENVYGVIDGIYLKDYTGIELKVDCVQKQVLARSDVWPGFLLTTGWSKENAGQPFVLTSHELVTEIITVESQQNWVIRNNTTGLEFHFLHYGQNSKQFGDVVMFAEMYVVEDNSSVLGLAPLVWKEPCIEKQERSGVRQPLDGLIRSYGSEFADEFTGIEVISYCHPGTSLYRQFGLVVEAERSEDYQVTLYPAE